MVDIHHVTPGYQWWQSTTDTFRMPKDRSADRHTTTARVIRPDPPELWDQLGETVGGRQRNAAINELVRRFLAGEPMPTQAEMTALLGVRRARDEG